MKPETMKAAVFTKPGKALEIREYPVQTPGKGDVGLKLLRSGICGTDVHILEGRLAIPGPFIPGHEFIGEVNELGQGPGLDCNNKKLRKGDKVIVGVGIPCGKCFSCINNETASCLNFGVTYLKDPELAPHFFWWLCRLQFCTCCELCEDSPQCGS